MCKQRELKKYNRNFFLRETWGQHGLNLTVSNFLSKEKSLDSSSCLLFIKPKQKTCALHFFFILVCIVFLISIVVNVVSEITPAEGEKRSIN